MKQIPVLVCLGVTVLLFFCCMGIGGNYFVPGLTGYVLDEPGRILLKRPLKEISGIYYINDKKVVAINDEEGKLFFINPDNGNFEVVAFGKKDDYEDLVKADSAYYVLNSKGHLFEIQESDNKLVATYTNDFGKKMEFESLCYDKANAQLLLICKECGKNSASIESYRFSLSEKKFITDPYFSIAWRDIQRLGKDNTIECKPSAAAINPIDGKLYIIASVGSVLLQCTINGALEAVYKLNRDHFPQAEGITFTSSGDLYITNEGGEGKASLLKFLYRP